MDVDGDDGEVYQTELLHLFPEEEEVITHRPTLISRGIDEPGGLKSKIWR